MQFENSKHQDEQYRLMNTDDHAMIVFDFSPYNATALQLTQEESRQAGMQVLHVVVIRSSTKARSTTTTGVFRSLVRSLPFSHFRHSWRQ
jgi:hypothetical protein